MTRWATFAAADPGRLHEEALHARTAIEGAREEVAALLGTQPRQVLFTSGGTEAVNAAVWGATRARPGGAVLCAPVEHSAVRDASIRLAPLRLLPVDGYGRIDLDGAASVLAQQPAVPSPALVHCQWANHEVGTLQPVAEIVELSHAAGIPVHVDAAAACGHVELELGRLEIDLVSVSAHKLGGPPGVGALVVHRGLRFDPLLVGGQQERARRAGMENVPGILGFGAAAASLTADGRKLLATEAGEARRRSARILEATEPVGGITLIGPPDPARRLPHLVCLGVEGVEAEPIVLGLDRRGIAVHSGSACSSESLEPSPVLEAMGVDANHSLRPSVGWSTNDADIEAWAEVFPEVVKGLRRLRGELVEGQADGGDR